IYIGLIGSKDGNAQHIILLPGDNGEAPWAGQMAWAKSIGGDLPTRVEQAMLWANHRDQFERDWYWSSEEREGYSGWAWYQGFDYGYQDRDLQITRLRARAVRRLFLR
ncbi:hypothetical protein, partial [Oceanospirillum multiglobuliferum]|uniref:hypothetical protein n=1 Tax=Oceanospirillum multiglobuliferum TaxID=64969 RepID=UPI001B802844